MPETDTDVGAQRQAVAIHEAGHALFALSQGGLVEWLTCESWVEDESGERRQFRNDAGVPLAGLCFYTLPDEQRDRPEIRLAGLLAGIGAEAASTGSTHQAGEALEALDLAREWLVDEYEAHTACRWADFWLVDLFRGSAAVLAALAAALLENGEMDGAEVATVVASVGGVPLCPLPAWPSVREAALAAYGGVEYISFG